MQALMLEHAFWLGLQRSRLSVAGRMLACPSDIVGQTCAAGYGSPFVAATMPHAEVHGMAELLKCSVRRGCQLSDLRTSCSGPYRLPFHAGPAGN